MTAPLDPLLISIGCDYNSDSGDVAFDPGGEPEVNIGLAQYYSRIGRLLAATQVLGSPGLAAGLSAFVGQPFTPQNEQAMLTQAQATILADPMTSSISSLTVAMPDQQTITVTASILLVNQTTPTTLSFSITPSGS